MSQGVERFREELRSLFSKATELGFVAVDVNAGKLHRRVGGYPGGSDHRMPACCDAIYGEMGPQDTVVQKPESGKGASVTVRFVLPRAT